MAAPPAHHKKHRTIARESGGSAGHTRLTKPERSGFVERGIRSTHQLFGQVAARASRHGYEIPVLCAAVA
eukprot:scaffold10059_cov123-Isochrysis_galbana.AAC.15